MTSTTGSLGAERVGQRLQEGQRVRADRARQQHRQRRQLHQALALVHAFDRAGRLVGLHRQRVALWPLEVGDARVGVEEQALVGVERTVDAQGGAQRAHHGGQLFAGKDVDVHVEAP